MTFSAFSDTMFITVEGQSYDKVLLAFGGIMWQAIVHSIREDVPVRGCVSCGDYFRSRDNLLRNPPSRRPPHTIPFHSGSASQRRRVPTAP